MTCMFVCLYVYIIMPPPPGTLSFSLRFPGVQKPLDEYGSSTEQATGDETEEKPEKEEEEEDDFELFGSDDDEEEEEVSRELQAMQ